MASTPGKSGAIAAVSGAVAAVGGAVATVGGAVDFALSRGGAFFRRVDSEQVFLLRRHVVVVTLHRHVVRH